MISPLRYTGGKIRAINTFQMLYDKLKVKCDILFFPFCGGCSFEFSMVDKIDNLILNDKFTALINFFQEITEFIGNVNKEIFKELKESQLNFLLKIVVHLVAQR